MKIYVTVEGGIVQGVSTDDPTIVNNDYVVIDYDTEGADADELECVQQGNDKPCLAFVGGGTIDLLTVKIGKCGDAP